MLYWSWFCKHYRYLPWIQIKIKIIIINLLLLLLSSSCVVVVGDADRETETRSTGGEIRNRDTTHISEGEQAVTCPGGYSGRERTPLIFMSSGFSKNATITHINYG